MATNKEIKAQAEARKRAYEAKLAQVGVKAKRRKNDNRFALVVAVFAVLLALGASYGHQAVTASASPSPSASATTATDAATASPTPSASASNAANVPSASLSENRDWVGHLNLNGHNLKIALLGKAAPQATANFISLAKKGFYKGITCHRLTTSGIYVLQCGDPKGDGTGGPGYSFGPVENAPANNLYKTGWLAMARQGGNGSSMGSQFFIVYKDSTIPSDNAGGYTVFGQILNGMTVVDDIAKAGTADGSGDGKPKTAVTLGDISVQ